MTLYWKMADNFAIRGTPTPPPRCEVFGDILKMMRISWEAFTERWCKCAGRWPEHPVSARFQMRVKNCAGRKLNVERCWTNGNRRVLFQPGIDSCHRSMEVFMGLFAPALISTICPCSDQSLALRYCGGSSLRQKTDPDLSNIGQKWWVHYLAVESSFFDWKMASFTIESSSFVYKTDLYPIAYLHMQKDRQRSHKIAIDQGQSTRLIEKQKRDSVCCFCSTTFPLCLSLLWHSAYGPSLFVEI